MRWIDTGLRSASKSRRKKALPGITILAINIRKPTANSSSLWETVTLFRRFLAVVLVLTSLSGGSLACISIESNSISRKSAIVPIISFK